MTKQF